MDLPRSTRRGHRAAAALLLWAGAGCAGAPDEGPAPPRPMEFDHVVVLVSDEELERWLSEFLTPAAALETRHDGQGTRGRYFLLLDAFVELLSLEDPAEVRENVEEFGSDYAVRWSAAANASPFAVGLTVDSIDPATAPFPAIVYRSQGGGAYLMARGNVDAAAPLVYATDPSRAYRRRASIDEVDSIEDPARREEVRRYLTHPAGMERLTRVVVTVPVGDGDLPNARLLDALDRVEVVEGAAHHLLLELDRGASGRTREFRGQPAVTLRY